MTPASPSSRPQRAVSLSSGEARALALRAQGFGDRRLSAERPIEVLRRLGALQLDSVSVLARPQDVVPFSRVGAYDVRAMHRAIYEQKGGFEYWGHEACWLPMAEYRYFRPRMRQFREWRWLRDQADQLGGVVTQVLERIRAEGPLTSEAFEDTRVRALPPGGLHTMGTGGNWRDRKPAKQALELLFAFGDLMIAGRTAGFGRVYDLSERVLPPGLDIGDPGDEAALRFLLPRAVAALGVATPVEAARYYVLHRHQPRVWRQAVEALIADGEIAAVSVEGWKGPALVAPGALAGPLTIPEHRPTFLSPFDNLIWERDRIERLFGFHYRIEIYVPAAKRTHGYYVLPLLARGGLAGRADLKHDRAERTLRVRGLWLEGAAPDEVAAALQDLAAHLAAEHIVVERGEPAAETRAVQRLLR